MKVFKIILAVIFLALIGLGVFYFVADEQVAQYYTDRGNSTLAKGNVEKALAYYEKALDRVPDNSELCMLTAEWYAQIEDYTKAEQVLAAGIRAMPDEGELYCKLSAVYVRQDKLLDASTMLDNITNETARAYVESLRPRTPEFLPAGGVYNEYFSAEILIHSDCYCFYSLGEEYPSVNGSYYSAPIEIGDGVTEIKAIAVDEEGNVSSIARVSYEVRDVLQVAEFVDSAFSAAVYRTLEKEEGLLIISDEAAQVESLTITEQDGQLTSLEDLHWTPNLKSLHLDGQSGLDWSQLSQLTGLEELSLTNCDISTQDLEVICDLSTLRSLDLTGNRIAGLTEITRLPALRELNVSMNSISSVEVLGGMVALTSLTISENAVADISALKNLPNLTYFDAKDNLINDLSVFQGNTEIQYLDFTRCPVWDLTPLAGCTGLETLNLDFCSVEDISALAGCTALKELYMSNNIVSDLTPLAELAALEVLDLSTNYLAELPDLSGMSGLREAYLSYNSISEVTPFVGLPALEVLDLDYNLLTSVAELAGCPNLSALYCFGNEVTDQNSLSGVTVYG